ncbi:hypothetical protein D3C87_2065950 [compost metagenome]
MDFAGTFGLTTTTLGMVVVWMMGAKSLRGSYESLLYRLGLTERPVIVANRML